MIWVLVLLSLALTAATLFSNISTTTLEAGFAIGAAAGLIGASIMVLLNRRSERRELARLTPQERLNAKHEELRLANDLGLAVAVLPGASVREPRRAARAALKQARNTFRMKPIDQLPTPVMSRQRFVGLIVLRSYLLIAFTLTIVKIAESAVK